MSDKPIIDPKDKPWVVDLKKMKPQRGEPPCSCDGVDWDTAQKGEWRVTNGIRYLVVDDK